MIPEIPEGATYRPCPRCYGTGNVLDGKSCTSHFPKCNGGHVVVCPYCNGDRYFDVRPAPKPVGT